MGRSLLSRRIFVRSAGQLAAGAAVAPWLACSGSVATEPGAPDAGDGAVPPEPPPALCLPFLTPIGDFYRQFGGAIAIPNWEMPDLDEGHVLEITGLVDKPLELTLADLEADVDHHVRVVNTLMCVWGYRSSGMWTGIPLRVLLDRAGVDRGAARRVLFTGADDFEQNLRITAVYENPAGLFEPLIAFHINEQRFPRDLGFPMRLLTNDRYGFKNIKWLKRIEVTNKNEEVGQYNAVVGNSLLPGERNPEGDYVGAAVVLPTPTVETHLGGETIEAGTIEMCGFALSGAAGIDRVQVSIDEGERHSAELATLEELREAYPEMEQSVQLTEPDKYPWPWPGVWALWRFEFDLAPGEHSVDIHVRDLNGETGDHATLTLTVTG